MRRWLAIGAALFQLLFVLAMAPAPQEPVGWSVPERVPKYGDLRNAPIMVSDQNRTVHAFDMETPTAATFAIVYRTWRLETGWSSPVDILLPEYLGIAPRLLDVLLDRQGLLHLIYYGGGQDSGVVYYSTALASEARNSYAWSTPIPIAEDAGPLESARIIETSGNRLIVAYAGQLHGSGLYAIVSSDRGDTWASPELIFRASSEDISPAAIELVADDENGVHVMWHMDNSRGLAEETWYGRYLEEPAQWQWIQRLSRTDDDLEFNGHPSLIEADDGLIAVYYDGFPPTRFMRRSFDDGKSWTPQARLFRHQGGYGHARIVSDGTGQLHMILGNRLQNPEIHGMWYSRWSDNAWQPLQPIISGPPTDRFDPTMPQVVVVQGNILLAVWTNDVRDEFRTGAWFSYLELEADELPLQPLPTATVRPVVAGATDGQSEQEALPAPSQSIPEEEGSVAQPQASISASPGILVLLSIAPVLAIVFLLAYRRRTDLGR